MSDEPEEDINDQLVLISGESGTGKSASLMNLRNHEKVLYMNCESGKKLPFRNKFQVVKITDPHEVYDGFDYAQSNPDVEVIVIDTLTFLMDMYESVYVLPSTNTMKAWGDYAQYFKHLMQQKVAKSDKQVIFLAHTLRTLDEKNAEWVTSVPVKGSLKNQGIEAYFSTVVSSKKKTIKDLKDYNSDLLHRSEQDERLGFKYCFQTQLTKETVNERIRSPMGMFDVSQTYIDNDVQQLLDHLKNYYS